MLAALALSGCGGSFVAAGADPSPSGDAEVVVDAPGTYVVPAPDAGGAGARDGATDAQNDVFVCDPTGDPKTLPCVIDDAYAVFVAAPSADAGLAADAATDGDIEADGGLLDGDTAGLDAEANLLDASAALAADATLEAGASLEAGVTSAGPGDGTMAHPVSTIGQGIALAIATHKTRVYVCDRQYTEQVTIASQVSLFGGFACPTAASGGHWSFEGGLAQVAAPSLEYALVVAGASMPVTIENMSFTTRDANAQDPKGVSSIAARIDGSNVLLEDVTLHAGRGADGANGADGITNPNYVGLAPLGQVAFQALDLTTLGGAGASNICTLYGSSIGGNGGGACDEVETGTNGSAIPPAPVLVPGRDGLAAQVAGAGTDPGADGTSQAPGAEATQLGTLSADGWVQSKGGGGGYGTPGQGGAGGPGSGGPLCGYDAVFVGGGGDSGGCGGTGGGGGMGGGGSIALISLTSTLNLVHCTMISGAGGTGGAGGAGQPGQAGSILLTGPTNLTSLEGAPGGNGAGGAGGAGGTAGVSLAIVSVSTNLIYDAATLDAVSLGPWGAPGVPGAGGPHGSYIAFMTGVDGPPGADGLGVPAVPPGPFLSLN